MQPYLCLMVSQPLLMIQRVLRNRISRCQQTRRSGATWAWPCCISPAQHVHTPLGSEGAAGPNASHQSVQCQQEQFDQACTDSSSPCMGHDLCSNLWLMTLTSLYRVPFVAHPSFFTLHIMLLLTDRSTFVGCLCKMWCQCLSMHSLFTPAPCQICQCYPLCIIPCTVLHQSVP